MTPEEKLRQETQANILRAQGQPTPLAQPAPLAQPMSGAQAQQHLAPSPMQPQPAQPSPQAALRRQGQGPITADSLMQPSNFTYKPYQPNAQEQDLLTQKRQADVKKTAMELWRKDEGGRGTGLIGAFVKSRKLKERPKLLEEKYMPLAEQMVSQAEQLAAFEAKKEGIQGNQQELFKRSLDMVVDKYEQDEKNTREDEKRTPAGTYWNVKTGVPVNVNFGRDGKPYNPTTGQEISLDGLSDRYTTSIDESRKKSEARGNVSQTLDKLVGNFLTLYARGDAISSSQGIGQNLFNYARNLPGIKQLEAATGSESSALKAEITRTSRSLMNDIRQATEMGVRGMDTPAELEFYMSTLGDPSTDLVTSLALLSIVNESIGRGAEDLGGLSNLLNAKEIIEAKTRLQAEAADKQGAVDALKYGGGLIDPRVGAPIEANAPSRPNDNPTLKALHERLKFLESGGVPK